MYKILNKTGLNAVEDYEITSRGTYKYLNPKAKNYVTGQVMEFSRPSTTGSLSMYDIYRDPKLDNYVQHNVNNGQITYYIDNSIKDAFYSPIYQIPNETVKIDYKDPMDSVKPHYALIHKNEDIFDYSCLSFINDTAFHRENLIASQQAKSNQSRITPFF